MTDVATDATPLVNVTTPPVLTVGPQTVVSGLVNVQLAMVAGRSLLSK
jgi:hypothetical protein